MVKDSDDLPTPGPTDPVPTWPEFEALRDAVAQYIEHDPPDPTYNHLSQALGAILGEYYREKFMQAHGLSEPAETACLARLIDGRDECPHNVVTQDDDPPDSWFSILEFARHYGLGVSVLPYSWYNYGRTVHVIFYPPERYRSGGAGE